MPTLWRNFLAPYRPRARFGRRVRPLAADFFFPPFWEAFLFAFFLVDWAFPAFLAFFTFFGFLVFVAFFTFLGFLVVFAFFLFVAGFLAWAAFFFLVAFFFPPALRAALGRVGGLGSVRTGAGGGGSNSSDAATVSPPIPALW